MSFGQMTPTWRCCAIMYSTTFGEKQMHQIGINTSYQLSSKVVERWSLSLTHQAGWWRMAKKVNNKGVAMAQSKFRPQTDLN